MATGCVPGVVRGLSLEEHLSKFTAHLLDVGCADANLVQLTDMLLRVADLPRH